eukprot:1907421-Heterocapsa_arctica.AAC.1
MGPLLWLDAIPESWEDDYFIKEKYDTASDAQAMADAMSSSQLDWNFGFVCSDVVTDKGVDIPGGSRAS